MSVADTNLSPGSPSDGPAALPLVDAGDAPAHVHRPRPRRMPALLVSLLGNLPVIALLCLLLPAARYLEGPVVRELADGTRVDPNLDPTVLRLVLLIGINVTLAVSLHLINGVSGQFSLGHAGFMAVGAYLAGYATLNYSENFERKPSALLYFLSLAAVIAIAAFALAIVYALVRSTRRAARWLPGFLFLVLLAWFVADLAMAGRGAAEFRFQVPRSNAVVRVPFVWAHAIQWLVDLFTSVSTTGEKSLTLLLALLGGGAAAAVAGLVVGLPTLRLRGDYLAIGTLGFGFIITNLITLSKPLGAATGLSLVPYANAAIPDEKIDAHFMFPWVYGVAIVTVVVVHRLTRSAKGRAILATREDEIAAAAVGIDTTHFKILAFVVGAFFAGVSGGLYAHIEPARLDPSEFGLVRSIEVVVMVTLGGLGRLWGAVLAAVLLTFLPFALRAPDFWINFLVRGVDQLAGYLGFRLRPADAPPVVLYPWVRTVFAQLAANQMVAYAAILIIAMLLRGRRFFGFLPRWRSRAGTSS